MGGAAEVVALVRLSYRRGRFWLELNGLPMARLPFKMTLRQVREVVQGLNEVAL